VMNHGRIEQQGSPRDLYYRPRTRFVANFFGDNNLLEGVLVEAQAVETALGRLPIGSSHNAPTGRKVFLSIRPESLKLGQGPFSVTAVIEEVMFGGAATRLLLHAEAAPDIKLDMRLPGETRENAPKIGERVSLIYDPLDAVIVEE